MTGGGEASVATLYRDTQETLVRCLVIPDQTVRMLPIFYFTHLTTVFQKVATSTFICQTSFIKMHGQICALMVCQA